MPNNLLLDPEKHLYTVDGKPVDGLTSIIKEAGLIRSGGDSWYMDRGSKIHRATEYWDQGVLDEDSLDPQIVPYLESWKRFRQDQSYVPTHIEEKFFNSTYRIAMTIDRLPGPVDLKSGSPEPWHILQIAVQFFTVPDVHRKNPMDVYLDSDGGPPKLKMYSFRQLQEAFKVYTSMLYFIRWRREKYGSSSSSCHPGS